MYSNVDVSISVRGGIFRWDKDESQPATLTGVNLTVPRGSLTAVVGQVGSGKSSLISAILGEMEKEEGTVKIRGNVAYVPQLAWLRNATLEQNILFGSQSHIAVPGGKFGNILVAFLWPHDKLLYSMSSTNCNNCKCLRHV